MIIAQILSTSSPLNTLKRIAEYFLLGEMFMVTFSGLIVWKIKGYYTNAIDTVAVGNQSWFIYASTREKGDKQLSQFCELSYVNQNDAKAGDIIIMNSINQQPAGTTQLAKFKDLISVAFYRIDIISADPITGNFVICNDKRLINKFK